MHKNRIQQKKTFCIASIDNTKKRKKSSPEKQKTMHARVYLFIYFEIQTKRNKAESKIDEIIEVVY